MSVPLQTHSAVYSKPESLLFMSFSPQFCDELCSWFKTPEQIVFWSGYKFGFPENVSQFRAQLKLDQIPAYALISDIENQLLGFGQMMFDNDRCHFVRIAVNPGLRGQGYGKKLLACLIAQGQRKFNPKFFSLFVNKSNQVAVNLYQTMGFKPAQCPGLLPNKESWYLEKPVSSK